MEQLLKIKFDAARFWVKAYDVSRLKQMSSFAKLLGNNIGPFIGCNEYSLVGVDHLINFQVDVDITKALKRGVHVKSKGK